MSLQTKEASDGTPNRNRTYNCPLGGGCYIHLTMEAYWAIKFWRGLFIRRSRIKAPGFPFEIFDFANGTGSYIHLTMEA